MEQLARPDAALRNRPGPKPRFSRDQLVEAAVQLVDDRGFAALSLRSVARALNVTPMALYTYVHSSDELADMVIDRLVELKSADIQLPDDWRDALQMFSAGLAELLHEHPALLQAYARGAVRTPAALRTAERLLSTLRNAGLSPAAAADAYASAHAVVLGHALQAQTPPAATAADTINDHEYPTLEAQQAAGYIIGRTSLHAAMTLIIDGVEAQLGRPRTTDANSSARRRRRRTQRPTSR